MKNKLGIKIFFEFKYADTFKEFINVYWHEFISDWLNLFTITLLSFIVFTKKLNIKQVIILFVIGYVVFYIFSIFINIIVCKVKCLQFNKKLENLFIQYKKYCDENNQLEAKRTYNEIEYLKFKHCYLNDFYDHVNNIIDSLLDECKQYKKEREKKKEEILNPYEKDMFQAETMLTILKEIRDDYPEWIKIQLTEVIKLLNKIIKNCKTDQNTIIIFSKTFQIFLQELINILNAYQSFSDEEKEENKEKINELFKALIYYLNERLETINLTTKEQFQISIETLMDELKNK